MLAIGFKQAQSSAVKLTHSIVKSTGISFVSGSVKHLKTRINNHVVPPTAGTLYKRMAVLTVMCLSMTAVFGSTFDVSYAQYSEDMLAQATQEGTLIADQDGYITKVNPQTTRVERTFKDTALYAVASGDTLSGIAKQFAIKTETLKWENGLSDVSTLKIGQKLNIPPANGISHRVAKGQTVEKIASLYKVAPEKIVAMNSLKGGVIASDQIIFVPEGKPLPNVQAPRIGANVGGRATARDSASRNVRTTAPEKISLQDSSAAPKAGKFLIFPTIGGITQGFRKGHYAFDIGNRSKPPIWAAAEGKVTKASSGTWGGGYGNHVIIDHGNGVQTLYAHLDYLDVSVGQQVTQGQVLGRMGRTGNVRGVTGIHLHFEVVDNGVKKAPSKFY